MKYRFNAEARNRYEHYRENLFRQYLAPSIERNEQMRKNGVHALLIPSMNGAIWTSETRAKKEAKKMVKWDKRMARLNKIPLSQIPRTEWAQNP
jgi:hypothetical protein